MAQPDNVTSFEQLFLSPSEMHKRCQSIDTHPYVIKKHRGAQRLIFVGSNHSHNSHDPQYAVLRDTFATWVDATHKHAREVLVEGGLRHVDNLREDQIIATHGEAGYAEWLARQANIPCISPEPSRHDEFLTLSQQFSVDEVAWYYFARSVNQWFRLQPAPDFEDYIQPYINTINHFSPHTSYALNDFQQIYKRKHHRKFTLSSREEFSQDSDPVQSPVAAACSLYRNRAIFSYILDKWQAGVNLFAVFGSGHVVTLEQAINQNIV